VSLKDTCDAFLKGIILIGCKIKLHETINICTGDPSSVKWIIEVWNNISRRIMISQQNAYGRLPYVVHAVGPRRKGDTSKVCGSNKKALTVLNWKPTRKIEDIIFDLAHDKKF
jgi:UDP-glucose 4-epimerase